MCDDSDWNYVTLDDLKQRELALKDPELFLQKNESPLIIDEVQYAPGLFSYIKIAVDKAQRSGMFWLTGSKKFHLMKGITESLAGRVAIINLLGFSQAEIRGEANEVRAFLPTQEWLDNARKKAGKPKKIMELYKNIWTGSHPKIVLDKKMPRDLFYDSYIQTYIQRDVKDIIGVTSEISFNKFLCAIAARTGQLLNYSDISRDVSIDHKTAKSWLSVLEASGLVYILYPYYNNVTKRIIKTPKIYFLDTGLCSYLTRWSSPESLEAGAMSGSILETYMFTEVLKSYWHNGKSPYFYYYRDMDQKEIDLIIEENGMLYPVEFKKKSNPDITSFKHFPTINKLGKKIGHGAVICLREEDIPLSREVDAIPIHYL